MIVAHLRAVFGIFLRIARVRLKLKPTKNISSMSNSRRSSPRQPQLQSGSVLSDLLKYFISPI